MLPIKPVKIRRIYYAKIKITGEVKPHKTDNPRSKKCIFQNDFLIGDFWKINVSIIIAIATIFLCISWAGKFYVSLSDMSSTGYRQT